MLYMDYETLARELVRALRGSRSQVALSRRLGYASNVAYAWEAGRRWPTAAEFFRMASRVGVDVEAAIVGFFRGRPGWLESLDPTSPEGVAALLADLRGNTPLVEVAERSLLEHGFARRGDRVVFVIGKMRTAGATDTVQIRELGA